MDKTIEEQGQPANKFTLYHNNFILLGVMVLIILSYGYLALSAKDSIIALTSASQKADELNNITSDLVNDIIDSRSPISNVFLSKEIQSERSTFQTFLTHSKLDIEHLKSKISLHPTLMKTIDFQVNFISQNITNYENLSRDFFKNVENKDLNNANELLPLIDLKHHDILKTFINIQSEIRNHETSMIELNKNKIFSLVRQSLYLGFFTLFYIIMSILHGFKIRNEVLTHEKKLRQMQGEAEATLDSLGNIAIISKTDLTGKITYVNQLFCNISGFSQEELIGKDHRLVNSKYHSKEYFENMWKTIKNKGTWRGEIRNRNKNGIYYWVDASITPIKLKTGEITGYLSARIDITKLRESIISSHESEEKLKESQKIARIGSWEYNITEDNFIFSEQMYQILNIKKDTNFNRNDFIELMHSEFKLEIKKLFEKIVKNGEGFKIWIKTSNNQNWIEMRARIHNFKNDLISGTCQDITETVGLNNKLHENEIFLNSFLDNLPGPCFSKDNYGQYRFVNKKFYDFVKVPGNNIKKLTDIDIFPTEVFESIKKIDDSIRTSKKPTHAQEIVPHPDGSVRYYDSFKFPILGDDGEVTTVNGIAIDITEKIQLEQALEIEKAKSIQTSKLSLIGEMAAGIAHEINNPLTIISGLTSRINRRLKDETIDKALIHNLVGEINHANDRMVKIVQGLRKFSRNDTSTVFNNSNLDQIINDTLVFCSNGFRKYNVELILELDSSINIDCNEIQISQVFLNFITNSLDAFISKPKDLNEKNYIKIASKRDSDFVVITIEDSGAGIQPEIKEKILTPFFTTKEVGKGTGLGLSISEGIVKSHNGKITLINNSNPTRFEIVLPLKQIKKIA